MRLLPTVVAAQLLAAAICAAQAGDDRMALELWINGVCTRHTIEVVSHGGTLLVSRADLSAAGVHPPGSGTTVVLDDMSTIRATLDSAEQRLLLTVPDHSMALRRLNLKPARAVISPPARGARLDYDLAAQAPDLRRPMSSGGAGFTGTLALFGPAGTLDTAGFARASADGMQGARLESAYVIDDPDRIRRWTLGDAISGGPGWSRPVRLAGIQLASDYSLRPDLVTIPLPAYASSTAVPASVDVLVGNTKVFEAGLDPGPFELENLPIVTGGSDATIVVRDILGRETAQTISLYETDDLLAPGLAAYSLEAGWLRRGFGTNSFDYGRAFASGTWRRGLTRTLTIEGHAQVAGALQVAGGGLAVALQPFAVVTLDGAASVHDGQSGTLLAAGLHGRLGKLTLFAAYRTASRRFEDIAALDGTAMPRRRFQAGMSASLGRAQSASLSILDEDSPGSGRSQLVMGTYALHLGARSLSLSGMCDRNTGRWFAGVSFNILLGGRDSAGLSTSTSAQGTTVQASYRADADPDGGFGWRGRIVTGAESGFGADASWYGDAASATGTLAFGHGTTGAEVDMQGSLIAMQGHVFATRRSGEDFALVRTGQPGARIYLENRLVARAGADGEALISGLVPFAPNRIAVNPDDYAMSSILERSERVAVPPRSGAVLVDLAPARRRPVLATVTLSNGSFPAPGARAMLERAKRSLVVGRNGKVFIDDLAAPDRIRIDLPAGSCRTSVIVPAKPLRDRIPEIGPLNCRWSPADAR